jgi:hypothetical protein
LKTFICACAFLFLSSSAFASDWLPLPQSIRDLLPVTHKEVLPPVRDVNVNIPNNRIIVAPPKSTDIMRIAPGKSQTVSLPRDAASVIVGSPAHASVFLDNSRLLVIVPRAPGATSFTVLDNKGETVLTQQVLVTEKDDAAYVRVTRICDGAGAACVPSTTYFCPDNCIPVAVPGADPNAAMPVASSVAAANNGSGSAQAASMGSAPAAAGSAPVATTPVAPVTLN